MKLDNATIVPWAPTEESPPVVIPESRVVDVQPAKVEDAAALVVWLVGTILIALLGTLPLYLLARLPAIVTVLIGMTIIGVLVALYLGMRFGWFHTVSHQRTERLRIKVQGDLGHRWFDYQEKRLAVEEKKLNLLGLGDEQAAPTMPQVAIHERGKVSYVDARDSADEGAEVFVKSLFRGNHLDPKKVLGEHTKQPGKVQIKKPPDDVYRRLMAAQMVKDVENGYVYTGPPLLNDALIKLM